MIMRLSKAGKIAIALTLWFFGSPIVTALFIKSVNFLVLPKGYEISTPGSLIILFIVVSIAGLITLAYYENISKE